MGAYPGGGGCHVKQKKDNLLIHDEDTKKFIQPWTEPKLLSPSLLLAEPSTFLCDVANCLLSLGEYQNNDKQLTVTSWGGGREQTKESSHSIVQ